MTPIEAQYRGTVNRIAAALLLFLGLFQLMGLAIGFLPLFLGNCTPRTADVIYELAYGLLYATVFVIPVLFYAWLSRRKPHASIDLALNLPSDTPLYIFAGIAVILAAAYFNSLIVEVFHYSSFSDEVLWDTDVTCNYQLVLQFFTMAVVPAFVEELLFRGMVLQNLLPYGRTSAVLASSLLFGAMHQNAGQLLYATVAGVVLGLIYVKTRSFWCCVLLHFCNNFFSIFQMAIYERMPNAVGASVVRISECTMLALGLFSAVVLLRREKVSREEALQTDIPAQAETLVCTISPRRKLTLFCSVPMIIFFALCAVQMVIYLLIAFLLY